MNYLLLALSVSVNAAYASLHNFLGKHKIKTAADNYRINTLTYGIGAILLLVLTAATWSGISAFTVGFGLLFGLVTAMAGVFELKALACGPMSFTVLITTSSMILPAFSGALIWDEPLSPLKVIGTALMITAAYFTAVKGGGDTSLRWLGYSMATFLCSGSIGIMQKVQQSSAHADESTPFLAVAFLCAAAICLAASRLTARGAAGGAGKQKAGILLPAAVCGGFIAFFNVVNLYLSGVLPSALLFPVQNGGTTVLSVLCAIVLFREALSRRRLVGLGIGMVALALLIV